jgi:signal transduction histidine kinase
LSSTTSVRTGGGDRGLSVVSQAGSVPAVAGDRDLLFEIVASLVGNAMKFNPDRSGDTG